MKVPILLAAALLTATPASATLDERELARAVARPSAGAMLPAGLAFMARGGERVTLGQIAAGKPVVLLFADYTCKHICGPGLTLAANALHRSRLSIGRDYALVVIGMDPRDGLDQARTMQHMRLSAFPAIERGAWFLVGDPAHVRAATAALGYGYVYDPSTDQFAHDASLYVFAADGHLATMLPELALSPGLARAAITHSGSAQPKPNLFVRAARLCYGFAAAHGVYGEPIVVALQAMGVLLMAGLVLALLIMWRRRRLGGAIV